MTTKLSVLLVVLLTLVALPQHAAAQPVNGLWDATVVVNNGALEIPFRFELSGSGSNVKGSFFNGDDKTTSTSGSLENGRLTLNFDELGTKLEVSKDTAANYVKELGDAVDAVALGGRKTIRVYPAAPSQEAATAEPPRTAE